jgi:hypothetical protein
MEARRAAQSQRAVGTTFHMSNCDREGTGHRQKKRRESENQNTTNGIEMKKSHS